MSLVEKCVNIFAVFIDTDITVHFQMSELVIICESRHYGSVVVVDIIKPDQCSVFNKIYLNLIGVLLYPHCDTTTYHAGNLYRDIAI